MVRTDTIVRQNRALYEGVTQNPTQFIKVDGKRVGYSVIDNPPHYKRALVVGEVVCSSYRVDEGKELFDANMITDAEFRELVDSVIEERESGLTGIVHGTSNQ